MLQQIPVNINIYITLRVYQNKSQNLNQLINTSILFDLPLCMFENVKMLTIEALLMYKLLVVSMTKSLNKHKIALQNNQIQLYTYF